MKPEKVYGQQIPAPRATLLGAALMALAVALPSGLLIWLVEWLF